MNNSVVAAPALAGSAAPCTLLVLRIRPSIFACSRTRATKPLRLELPSSREATGRLRGIRAGETAAAQMLVSTSRRTPGRINSITLSLEVQITGDQMRMEVPAAIDSHQFVLYLTPGDKPRTNQSPKPPAKIVTGGQGIDRIGWASAAPKSFSSSRVRLDILRPINQETAPTPRHG